MILSFDLFKMKMTMVQGVLGALHRHLAAESKETEHGEKQMKIEDPHKLISGKVIKSQVLGFKLEAPTFQN